MIARKIFNHTKDKFFDDRYLIALAELLCRSAALVAAYCNVAAGGIYA